MSGDDLLAEARLQRQGLLDWVADTEAEDRHICEMDIASALNYADLLSRLVARIEEMEKELVVLRANQVIRVGPDPHEPDPSYLLAEMKKALASERDASSGGVSAGERDQ